MSIEKSRYIATNTTNEVSAEHAATRNPNNRTIVTKVARTAMALLISLSAVTGPTTKPEVNQPVTISTDNPPVCRKGVPENPERCYSFVGGTQKVKAKGMSVDLTWEDPRISSADSHTNMEFFAGGPKGTGDGIEAGWIVMPGINGNKAWFFTDQWTNNQTTFIHNSGFVQTSKTMGVGDVVKPGTTTQFGVIQRDGRWVVLYDKKKVGYYPDSLWKGKFRWLGGEQAFGEVGSYNATPCTQMGNGQYGTSPGAARISGYTLFGSGEKPDFKLHVTDPAFYTAGNVTRTGMTLGGPGLITPQELFPQADYQETLLVC